MKDFIEQLNDMAAPLTRAYSEPEIVRLEIHPGSVKEEEAEFMLLVKVKRTANKNLSATMNLVKGEGMPPQAEPIVLEPAPTPEGWERIGAVERNKKTGQIIGPGII